MRRRVGSWALALVGCGATSVGAATAPFAGGCGGPRAPRAMATAPARPSQSGFASASVYRFVAAGGRPEHTIEQSDGSVAVVGDGRSIVRPDGSMAKAPGAGMGGIQVPARLGGGYLFWENDLGYTRMFLGDPVPVAPLRTNVIVIHYGHDAVLLFGPGQERRAFSLDPPRRVPLSPHGVVAIGGANDDRVLAVDAAGRSRASIDGGRTWKDVTTDVGKPPQGVLGLPGDVAFVLDGQQGAWLRADGTFERRPLPSTGREGAPEPKPADRAYYAVLTGHLGPGGRVLLTEHADVFEVDLATGETSARRSIGPAGASCGIVTTSGEGLAACDTYSVRGRDVLDIVAHALGSAPSVETTFAHHPLRFAVGASLVVVAACPAADAAAPVSNQVVCVRGPSGGWSQFDAARELGSKWKVLGWLGREGDAPMAVVWEQGVRGRKPDYGLLDPVRSAVVTLDAEVTGLGNVSGRWTVRSDGTIHGFTPTGAVTIDARGHVTPGTRSFGALAYADDHALARDAEWRLWQTTDSGATWVEVARPPVDGEPRQSFGRVSFPSMGCGRLGCAIEHPSGLGNWVRLGWPNDPPYAPPHSPPAIIARAAIPAAGVPVATVEGGASTRPGVSGDAGAAPVARSAVVLPRLVCTIKAELKPNSEAPPKGAARAGAKSVEALGGQRLPSGPAETALVVPYRDQFRGPDEGYAGSAPLHALRAVLRLDVERGGSRSGGRAENVKSTIDALYVDAFDPTGRIRHATGSLVPDSAPAAPSQPASPAAPSIPPGAATFDETFNAARPVLAAGKPGEAAGVLIAAGGQSQWIAPSGAVRRTARCRGELQTYGGVVDTAGKLWIACGDYSRALDVIDGDTGQVRIALPPVLPWVWQPEVAFPLYAGGRATDLPNPDAIALDSAGKLTVLRLPSEEPATVDDPAWLLSVDAAPVELAPWSTLEPASSPACMARDDDAVRSLIQTAVAWVTVDGALGFREPPGMTALVRWGRRRVCLEAIEVGYRQIKQDDAPRYGVQVMAVARFVGARPGAGLVGLTRSETYRVPASCRLETTPTASRQP
jgi:hypothetical protein